MRMKLPSGTQHPAFGGGAFPISRIIDQFEFRKHLVLEALEANDIPFKFDAIVGRGDC